MSNLLDRTGDTDRVIRRYTQPARPKPRIERWLDRRMNGSLPEYSPRNRYAPNVHRNVAIGSGRTNPWMSGASKVGRGLGVAGSVLGVGFGIYNVVTAPPGETARVAAGEGGAFLGGALGATLGTGLAVFALGLLLSNPLGWLVIGVGMIGGFVGGYFGSRYGRELGDWIGSHF